MGAIVPQVVTEDRAGGALIVDGGLRFNQVNKNYLTKTVSDCTSFTLSFWYKPCALNNRDEFFDTGSSTGFYFYRDGQIKINDNTSNIFASNGYYRDPNSFYHVVGNYNGTVFSLYVNGVLDKSSTISTQLYSGTATISANHSTDAADLLFSQYYLIDGQALGPEYFGYTDPLTNVWRPKKLSSSIAFGTNGFYLPFDGSAPIGQDQSGRGNNWTPVNFGGSTSLEKATGALPILNTDGGGKVARVGVRTDANASSLVLALPLVGIKSDFSNAINSGTSNKAITVNGNAAASSAQSNFYGGSFVFDGTGDYLSTPAGTSFPEFTLGTSNYTIEMWFNVRSLTNGDTMFSLGDSGSLAGDYVTLEFQESGKLHHYVSASSQSINGPVCKTDSVVPTNTWHHVAVTRSGNVFSMYFNGVLQSYSITSTATILEPDNLYVGSSSYSLSDRSFDGYIQDVRLHKGAVKYTSNFIPASTDPDIVPDSPSGVSYSSNLALVPSTDGAVAFDGSGDSLTTANSTDYAFSTGDYTVEAFVYLNSTSANQIFVGNWTSGTGWQLYFTATGNKIAWYVNSGILLSSNLSPSTGRWYHIAVSRSGSTLRMFIDGVLDNSTTDSTNYSTTQILEVGYQQSTSTNYLTGFLSNIHIVKGTALYTSNFTPPSAPISSVENTKLLCCKSNTSATAFDVSPGSITANGNAAATNFNPFTVDIDTVRGKQSGYCTLSPLRSSSGGSAPTVSEGNLTVAAGGGGWCNSGATIDVNSGKWYWEVYPRTVGGSGMTIGIASEGYEWNRDTSATGLPWLGSQTGTSWSVYSTGQKYFGASGTNYMSAYTSSDTVGVAFDMDAQTLTYYLNGVSQGVAFSGVNAGGKSIQVGLSVHATGSNKASINFGQKPFKFPPPPGFQPLTLANLPRPSIVRPDQYVGISTWTGTGAARDINVGWKPDFVWIKERGSTGGHVLYDTVRGATKHLASHSTNGENTDTDALTSFTSNGFSLGSGYTVVSVNGSTRTYVGWSWKAGGNSNTFNINDIGYSTASAAGLTAGTITPTGASVNTKSGFSIITHSGSGSTGTISHGLGKAPAFIITKIRNSEVSSSWQVYHQSLGATKYITLDETAAAQTSSTRWNDTAPTSSLISLGSNTASSYNWVMYSWAEIPGFSKFGSYSGNSSADGVYVATGFKPRWLLVKKSSSTGNERGWVLVDSERSKFNVSNLTLFPHANSAEDAGTYIAVDFLSNGFKLRSTEEAANASYTYIYACFAETPSFNLYGAMSNAR